MAQKEAASSISQPTIVKKFNGLYFTWEKGDERHIVIGLTRINQDFGRNSIEAEIEIGVDSEIYQNPSGNPSQVAGYARTNLLSLSARETLIRHIEKSCMSEIALYIPWQQLINQVFVYAISEIRKGEPVIILDADWGNKKPEMLLPPLFVKNAANIIYADRSSAKSLFVTLVDMVLSLPWHNNPLGFHINADARHKVLFLDWENDASITGWQKECIVRGMGLEWCELPYLHCARPLVDSVEDINSKIAETQADIIIIDSLGMAVCDDLNLTKPALAFHGALRQLPVTPIIIAHTSKDILNKRKTVYGNAFYENEARSVWEISKQQEPGSSELTITLHHRKSPPFAAYHESLAWRFIFEGDRTRIEISDPSSDKRESLEERTIEDKILNVLMNTELHLGRRDIIARMKQNKEDFKETSVGKTLQRMASSNDAAEVAKDDEGNYYYIP